MLETLTTILAFGLVYSLGFLLITGLTFMWAGWGPTRVLIGLMFASLAHLGAEQGRYPWAVAFIGILLGLVVMTAGWNWMPPAGAKILHALRCRTPTWETEADRLRSQQCNELVFFAYDWRRDWENAPLTTEEQERLHNAISRDPWGRAAPYTEGFFERR